MNSSGPISLAGPTAGQSIEIENGGNGTTQISLNDAAVRSLAGVPSGTITMPTNFYGKSNQYTYTISANQTNFCIRAGAVSAGWNQSSKLVVNINSGVILSANGTGAFGAYIQGSFPGGITVNNAGVIVGAGGGGGGGGLWYAPNCCYGPGSSSSGSNGDGAGKGLYIRSAVSINNTGVIAGGGGGGGGAGGGGNGSGGGGGGRSSNAVNTGGGAGSSGGDQYFGSAGGTGTYNGAGGGGYAGHYYYCYGRYQFPSGGDGGGWGAAGAAGAGQCGGPGYGGSGGAATCGAPTYVTWIATGTRYGSIS